MHGAEMFQLGDQAHKDAMQKMQELMQDQDAMKRWMDQKRCGI